MLIVSLSKLRFYQHSQIAERGLDKKLCLCVSLFQPTHLTKCKTVNIFSLPYTSAMMPPKLVTPVLG